MTEIQKNSQLTWDVSEEEANRINLPANDCRRFNGGQIATPEQQAAWKVRPRTTLVSIAKNQLIVINRLREELL